MAINKEYLNPNGIWEVTTEGDCEGRSQRSMGVYEGRLDEIAFALASSACYTMTFKKIIPSPLPASTARGKSKAFVKLDGASGWNGLSAFEQTAVFNRMLKDTDIFSGEGKFHNSVTLTKVTPEEKKKANIRSAALAKLSDEEKAALGLSDLLGL